MSTPLLPSSRKQEGRGYLEPLEEGSPVEGSFHLDVFGQNLVWWLHSELQRRKNE
jgi:hypothetical protein